MPQKNKTTKNSTDPHSVKKNPKTAAAKPEPSDQEIDTEIASRNREGGQAVSEDEVNEAFKTDQGSDK